MVKRRKMLIGMGALAAGSAAGMGTGALSNMSSGDRSVTVNVADDANGYVGLGVDNESPHSHFVTGDGLPEDQDEAYEKPANEIALNFSDDNSPYFFGGDGVNPGSTYEWDNVFEIYNFASTTLDVWITKNNLPGVSFYVRDDPSKEIVHSSGSTPSLSDLPSAATSFAPSNFLDVGVEINADQLNEGGLGEVSGSIEINAINAPDNRS